MQKLALFVSAVLLTAFLKYERTNDPLLSSSDKNKDTGRVFPLAGKTVTVYTTAEATDYRLTKTDSSKQFGAMNQSKETNIAVFVDPLKKFQTMVGIGGALTDASAETFARLPNEKQTEFIKAYFGTVSSIVYLPGRIL